jgi:hypothetical protein
MTWLCKNIDQSGELHRSVQGEAKHVYWGFFVPPKGETQNDTKIRRSNMIEDLFDNLS